MSKISTGAGSRSSQNLPSHTVPWWYVRRVARRGKKVKGSNPPGLKHPPGVAQATGVVPAIKPIKVQAILPNKVPAILPSKIVPAIKPKPKTYAQALCPETRPTKSVQDEVRRVVRSFGSELRKLVRDIRAQIFNQKKSPKGGVKLKEPTKVKEPSNPIAFAKSKVAAFSKDFPKFVAAKSNKVQKSEFVLDKAINVTVTQPVVFRPSGGFDASFDYKRHELNEQARIEWRKLTNRMATLYTTTKREGSGEIITFNVSSASKIVAMYITDFGREHFDRFKYELEGVCGYTGSKDLLNRLENDVTLKNLMSGNALVRAGK